VNPSTAPDPRPRFAWWALAVASASLGCSSSHASARSSPDSSIQVVVDASTLTPVDSGTTKPRKDSGTPLADSGTPLADSGATKPDAAPPTCITPSSPASCAAPRMTALPICNLALTGCMDANHPTAFAASAISYEVNSPLWSDGAAKARAFVLPSGGKIHVDASTGKWAFPVGTVLLKNFLFDDKVVETRLFMHVDDATAALIGNGTNWVGYNYAWNEEQTEATIVPNARTGVSFRTGKQTVNWNYPSFFDCIGCHSNAIGPIGPETDQMNRTVGTENQIDTFATKRLFDDSPPAKPYAPALVEPYANGALGLDGPPPGATVEDRARSYLAANCSFCHRADVNDQGFDLRSQFSLGQTGICNLMQQNGIPGMTATPLFDFKPGDHAKSAVWIRMNTPVPASDPGELEDVGRMPPVASFVVDSQATALIAQWIDSTKSCPLVDGGN